jgi:hypothetical protein
MMITKIEAAHGIAKELLAVEMLEYHNKNWLVGSDESRSKRKQRLLRELVELLEFVRNSG